MLKLYPPCENVSRYLIPLFRSLVAADLVGKYDFTQVEAAEKLGTTQAAISQYIHSKRGYKVAEQFSESLSKIQAFASETAKLLAKEKMEPDEDMSRFCEICRLLQKKC